MILCYIYKRERRDRERKEGERKEGERKEGERKEGERKEGERTIIVYSSRLHIYLAASPNLKEICSTLSLKIEGYSQICLSLKIEVTLKFERNLYIKSKN